MLAELFSPQEVPFEFLLGKTLLEVAGAEKGSGEIVFKTTTGETYRMYHIQSCCEEVDVEDVVGDPSDLLGCPLLMAEEVVNDEANPEDYVPSKGQQSFTWTFYKLATVSGYVTIRWYGESNGYYSESVTFKQMTGTTERDRSL